MSEELEVAEFDPRALLIRALTNHSNSRARTQQKELGPSSIGDCRRKVWHQIRGDEESNETEILPALLGTFIHEGIAKALAEDDSPFDTSKQFLLEHETGYAGMPGHVDFYHKGFAVVCDWKSSTKAKLKDFPTVNNIWQVQNYGLMLAKEGYPVKKVAIVVIPRDGRMDQIASWVGDYDEAIALQGRDWVDDIITLVETGGEAPAPEKYRSYCQLYCEFFDESGRNGCPSKSPTRLSVDYELE